jgi:periodic tryptophan protein 1
VCRSNLEDPYITLEPVSGEGSEEDDDAIRDTDLIILAARNEDDVSHLEVCPEWHPCD